MNIGEIVTSFIASTKRILTVSRKPDANEFTTMAKITGLGIILIAVIGFIVTLIFKAFGLGI